MDPQQAAWRPLATAELDWDAGGAPRSRRYGDIYFNPADGPAETRHVFLRGNDLPGRWRGHDARVFRIGELGFGTGLNFLVTLDTLRREAPPGLRLHYWAVEAEPLRRDDLARCTRTLPNELQAAGEALANQYPPPVPGVHRLLFDDGRVVLDLSWGDAAAALGDLAGHGSAWFDAWYLDGFAPAKNASLWADTLWPALAGLSRPAATVATFTAAGAVRRGLAAAGFAMTRREGFGAKRESLHGRITAPPALAAVGETPWDRPDGAPPAPASALVIGAGIAGACAAAALARRGVAVTVLEAGAAAGRGSGNSQGVLFTRLSHRRAPLTDIALLGYLDAARRYRELFDRGALRPGEDGELAGCFQQAGPKVRLDQLAPALAKGSGARRGPRPGSGRRAPRRHAGRPGALAAALRLAAPRGRLPRAPRRAGHRAGRTLRPRCSRRRWGWLAGGGGGRPALARRHRGGRRRRGERNAGRAGLAAPAPDSRPGQLAPRRRCADDTAGTFCHSGYVTPPRAGALNFGASFTPGDDSLALRPGDHRHNLHALAEALPSWAAALAAVDPATVDGRAELRCGAPDYLPLAGAVPEPAAFRARYQALARNARTRVPAKAPCVPGLYLSTGHGSRGLCSAPLAGELIASEAFGEPPPLPRPLLRALAPARFLLRDLVRSQSTA